MSDKPKKIVDGVLMDCTDDEIEHIEKEQAEAEGRSPAKPKEDHHGKRRSK